MFLRFLAISVSAQFTTFFPSKNFKVVTASTSVSMNPSRTRYEPVINKYELRIKNYEICISQKKYVILHPI